MAATNQNLATCSKKDSDGKSINTESYDDRGSIVSDESDGESDPN